MAETQITLRISDILYAIIKRRVMIAALTAAGLVIGIILSIISYARGEISKEYMITTSIAVTSQTEDGLFTTHSRNPESVDIYLAENMVDSVMYVIKSDKLINAAVNRMGLIGVASTDIINNLHLNQYNETQIIEMTLYWRNAEEGVQILSAINSVSPSILVQTLKIGSVSVVNDPTARYRVGGNVNASLWVYMAVLGMMAGIGLSVLLLLLQPTIVNTNDLERSLGLKVLGEIPSNRLFFNRKPNPLEGDPYRRGEDVIEGFISTAYILHNQLGRGQKQCFYITSSTKNEGKTTISAYLAFYLSTMEHKVLLVDFDVRNPSLGSLFLDKVNYPKTLNALYRGDSTEEEALVHLTGYLDLLPAILENKELPLDDAMLSLIRRLTPKYDYILMDTAPIGLVADTMSLNRIAQNALLVIQHDSTATADVKETASRLEKSGIQIVGCIVNDVKHLAIDRNNMQRRYYRSNIAGELHRGHRESFLERHKRTSAKFSSSNQSTPVTDSDAEKENSIIGS